MDVLHRFAVPGMGFLLVLVSGLWLSRRGKPLNSAIFNVHKLIALGVVIAVALQARREPNLAAPQAVFAALLVVAGACVVALFTTGALMSIKPGQAVYLTIHKAAIVLSLIIWPLALGVLGGALP